MKCRVLLPMLLLTLAVVIAACAPAPMPVPTAAPPVAPPAVRLPTSAPAATQAPPPTSPSSAATAVAGPAGGNPPAPVVDAQRKIIKNAQLTLTVEKTDSAVDRLTGITTDMGGYILSVRTFFEGRYKGATLSFAVPVDRFEESLRRVRGIAIQVDQENASGQDVSDQYVDLESQLRNLQATADRIREFLKKAQTVDEALKVNQQLSDVEKQIEAVKGKMGYIEGRSAFSTITVEVRELQPTPTPTPSPTPTRTPTPVAWHPDETFAKAVDTQTNILRALADLIIWVSVLVLPYIIVGGVALWLVLWLLRRLGLWVSPSNKGSPPKAPGSP